jgi:curli biogenesis system outer membrane secretion channel CsgG
LETIMKKSVLASAVLASLLAAGSLCTTPALAQGEAVDATFASRPADSRPLVTIYEFDSSVPEVNGKAATDMFKTTLIKSGQFRVLERAHLSDSVLKEKQLNASGQASGDTAQKQLAGARYIFEGTVSEANSGEEQDSGGISIGGLQLGGGHNTDTMAIDVQIVDADSGEILDAVTVKTRINSSNVSVGGIATLISAVASAKGYAASPYTPDVNYQSSRKESVDAALRASIEQAVRQLRQRLVARAG